MADYRICDEPTPSTLTHLVVQPLWPLFALMLAGFWLALPWFCFNAVAMGCPNQRRTFLFAALALTGKVVLILGLVGAAGFLAWDEYGVRYAMLSATVWELGIGYYLYVLQARTFELYTYFGGKVKNGLLLVIAGTLLAPRIFASLPALVALVLR